VAQAFPLVLLLVVGEGVPPISEGVVASMVALALYLPYPGHRPKNTRDTPPILPHMIPHARRDRPKGGLLVAGLIVRGDLAGGLGHVVVAERLDDAVLLHLGRRAAGRALHPREGGLGKKRPGDGLGAVTVTAFVSWPWWTSVVAGGQGRDGAGSCLERVDG